MGSNSDIGIRTMRAMAWERAKGELQSILVTFWGEQDSFEQLTKEIDAFVKQVEDNGLAE
jgi:hypothetical protein